MGYEPLALDILLGKINSEYKIDTEKEENIEIENIPVVKYIDENQSFFFNLDILN